MLSIIIPTHERHDILKRSIDYYKNFKCTILIADSSVDKINCKFPNNIIYRHFPKLSFTKKILKIAETAVTPYVCVTGDDDFLLESSLQVGLRFLDQNLDFVSVQGRYLKFELIEGEIIYSPKNNPKAEGSYAVTGEDIFSRITKAYNPYKDQMVSIHRLDSFIKAFRSCADVTHHFMTELASMLVPMCYGKHKVLPILWMIRDAYKFYRPNAHKIFEKEKLSVSTIYFGVGGHKKLLREVDEFLKSKEALLVKDKFAREISELVSDEKESDKIFEVAFKSFNDWIINDRKKIIIKKIIKLLTPTWIINYYKARRNSHVINLTQTNSSGVNDVDKIELTIRAFPEIYTVRREKQDPKAGTPD